MNTLFSVLIGVGQPEEEIPSEDPLQSGYICLGDASDRTGEAWCDNSSGTSYGNGTRYDREESRFITKIPSKHDRENY